MSKEPHLHGGHRSRMRQKFLCGSPSDFLDHEILEMLLYYTDPRGNTNDTAHALIEAFSSLDGVLEADVDQLKSVFGVGEKTALLLALLGETAKRYTVTKMSPNKKEGLILNTPQKIAQFMLPRFIGTKKEQAFVLLVDNGMMPLDCFPIGDGSVISIALSVRNIAERAYSKHAAGVVLAHNHPNGVAYPSEEDISVTHRLKEALSLLEIPLIEHFIFAGNEYIAILGKAPPRQETEHAASSIFQILQNELTAQQGEQT